MQKIKISNIINKLKRDKKEIVKDSPVKTKIVNNILSRINNPNITRLGRNIAIGAAREIINKNPVSSLASKAALGAAKNILPDNKYVKNVLDLSHEIIHGTTPIIPETKKKKWYSFFNIQFLVGAVITFFLTFLFIKK